ncbi:MULTISPECIES: hypothetical protein [unclassified Bradyrhizobium]|uniref:hypothetical protein n=1 Tax=unclassified Bradyrhizobium TaxID=2631580 RepID=UPI002479DC96|nr:MULTISPECIES: hypothetical protein [unclassified Bradyrhizobium]WGR93284.1 hypothetical protein MTX20_37020 [Bradyrhizobium sp. ISRA435]WGR97814.1 hypothetical protein MTX23_26030 [Bradyrhizobium sp. ISRA436]WGS04703.1 hypothetical protein MTX18_26035 [Bradyrhizobium sp. ISRA437]WGS11584.1 hypothetical protein MTX26_26035 [Bradyrhizobium sp. ISRA443]WGS19073.1 hypothetical protein MTX22_31985 [Bradyrhizobium sp. ISRA463]
MPDVVFANILADSKHQERSHSDSSSCRSGSQAVLNPIERHDFVGQVCEVTLSRPHRFRARQIARDDLAHACFIQEACPTRSPSIDAKLHPTQIDRRQHVVRSTVCAAIIQQDNKRLADRLHRFGAIR